MHEAPPSESSLSSYPDMQTHYDRSIDCFLLADAVQRKVRDGEICSGGLTTTENTFNRILDQVFYSLIDDVEKDYPDGLVRCRAVTSTASKLSLKIAPEEPVAVYIYPKTLIGMVHQLVEQNRICGWTEKDLKDYAGKKDPSHDFPI